MITIIIIIICVFVFYLGYSYQKTERQILFRKYIESFKAIMKILALRPWDMHITTHLRKILRLCLRSTRKERFWMLRP